MIDIRFHPDAQEELGAAFDWYLARNAVSARSFLQQIDHAVDQIREHPEAWPQTVAGARRYIVRTFPFHVVYLVEPQAVEIVAVAHDKRRPGYWRDRVGAI